MKGLQVIVNGPLRANGQVEIVLPSDVGKVDRTIVIGKAAEVEASDVGRLDLDRLS